MSVISPGNLTKLREQRHATRLYLAVYSPATVWSGRVNGTQTQGDTTITVDGVVQVSAPEANYQVLIGSSANARDYGETRFRSYSAPTLTVSAHNSQLPDDAYITIKEFVSPQAVHVTIDDTDVVFEDGDVAYTNESLNYPPLARMGAPVCAFVDLVTNQVTINFYGRGVAVASGATLTAHAWTFGAGSSPATSASQGTSGAPIAVTYTGSGVRYVSYQVTDSNGKTHKRYTPVFIFDRLTGTLPYTQVEISGMQESVDTGVWSCTVRVYTDADTTDFPPMGQVVLFTEDYYDDVLGSIGNELYRENIKLTGYIRRGTIRKNWLMGYVEFQVSSMPMDAIPQIAGGLETNLTTPTGWHQLKDMTFALACYHVLTKHSTITQIADCYFDNIPNYTIEFLDLAETTIGDGLRQMLAAVRSRWGFSAQGSLYLEINPQLQSLASRSTAYQITTTFADMRDDIDLGDDTEEKNTGQIDFAGEDANADPVFSLAPATTWANAANTIEKIDGIRIASQTESNEFSGLYEGWRNNKFADVLIPWRGNYPMDCFPAEPIAVSIAANQNARGIVWSNQRCWTKAVSCEYHAGVWTVTSTLEKDAYGLPGITGNYPTEPPPPPPPPIPSWIPSDIPPPIYPNGPETHLIRSKVYVATATKGIFYSSNFTDVGGAMPTWTTVNGGLAAITMKKLTADPILPSGHQYCLINESAFSGGGSHDVYYRAGAGSWASVLDRATAVTMLNPALGATDIVFQDIDTNINLAGFVSVIVIHSSGLVYYLYSLDYGATWAAGNSGNAIASATTNATVFSLHHGLFQGTSSYAAGQVIYVTIGSDGVFTSNKMPVSVDGGTTWSTVAVTVIGDWEGDVMQIDPFQDVCYAQNITSDAFYRSIDRGANWAAITPPGFDWGGTLYLRESRDYRIQPVYDPASSPKAAVIRLVDKDNKVYKSIDSGTTWTSYAAGIPTTNVTLGIAVLGDAPDKLYGIDIYGATAVNKHHVWVSDDEGVTWEGKSGTDRSATTVDGIPQDAGGVVGILPVYL